MKKAKRTICFMMAAFILVTAPIASYNQANAAEIVGTMEMLQALLEMFGVSVGLGAQSDYFSQSSFEDFATAVSNGTVYHMDKYGDVDFSDDASVREWLEWANGIDEYITSPGWSPMDKYDASIKAGAGIIDYASYKITGTSATTAMHSYIEELIGDYNGSSEAFAEDIRDTFTVITGGTGNDNDDDETKKKRSQTRFACFTGLTGAMILSMGGKLTELVGLKHPETSDFSEYDAAFEEGGFVPGQSFPVYYNSSVSYFNNGDYLIVGYYFSSEGVHSTLIYPFEFDKSLLFGVKNSDGINIFRTNIIDGKIDSSYFVVKPYCIYRAIPGRNDTGFDWFLSSEYNYNKGSFLFPVFSSINAFTDYCLTGDTSGILNLKDSESYVHYKENAPSAAARLPKRLESWIMSPDYLQKLPSMLKPVFDAADSSAGRTDSIDAVDDAIKVIAPTDTEVVDPPVPEDPADYSGILGKILAAINKIISLLNPVTYVTAFAKKFMTADSLTELLNSMPQLFAEAYASALVLPLTPVIDAINGISESLVPGLALSNVIAGAIASVFPRVGEVTDAIIAFPETIADTVAGITIEVPDIRIPEITIPDVISIAKLDISELSVPAMANPVIDLTLNPSYDITVSNDFTGLGSIISTAVQGVLTACFVPDEALTMSKITAMKEYFKFTDDMENIITDFKNTVFFITPNPILKIPVGKSRSEKYNYGIGNYIIIDVSWYAEYKDFGDKVILAFAWAFFIWRLYVLLPGIISGSVGGFFQLKDVDNEISIKKNYEQIYKFREMDKKK